MHITDRDQTIRSTQDESRYYGCMCCVTSMSRAERMISCGHQLQFVAIHVRNCWFRHLAFALGWKANGAKLPSAGLWL